MYERDQADRRMAETPSLAAYLPHILAYPLSGYALGARLISVLIGRKQAEAVVLAAAALTAKREGLFQRLTQDALTRYAKDPALVSLQFLTAKFWYEQKHDEARAREILKPLLAQTTHPQYRQIAAYAKAIGA